MARPPDDDDHDESLIGFAMMALSDREDPHVLIISNCLGGYDAPTGLLGDDDLPVKIVVATERYFEPFTDRLKAIFQDGSGVDLGPTIRAGADGRHPIDALYEDYSLPANTVVVIFADRLEWAADLQLTRKLISKVGDEGRIMMVFCDCTKAKKFAKLKKIDAIPPVTEIMVTSECGGVHTMGRIVDAILEVAEGSR
jgi:hypothetical protein